MKKFLLGIVLPVLTLVTLIGTGFATWYFNENNPVSVNNDLNTVEVTGYATVGKVDITKPVATKITLDQPKSGVDGITLDNAIIATYTPETGSVNVADGATGKFVCTVTIPKALAQYVELKTAGFTPGSTASNGDVTYTKTVDFNDQTLTITIAKTDFQYVSAQVPTTVQQYTTMKTVVQNAKITVNFTATLNTQKA